MNTHERERITKDKYNQLILGGLTTEDVGYNPETKEYRVVLDESNESLLEEGLTGLRAIVSQR